MNRDTYNIFEEYREIAPGVWRDVEDVATEPMDQSSHRFRVVEIEYTYTYTNQGDPIIASRNAIQEETVTAGNLRGAIEKVRQLNLIEVTASYAESGQTGKDAFDYYRQHYHDFNIYKDQYAAVQYGHTRIKLIIAPHSQLYNSPSANWDLSTFKLFDRLADFNDPENR